MFVNIFSVLGMFYFGMLDVLKGVVNFGFMMFLKFCFFVIVFLFIVCLIVWYVIECMKVGVFLCVGMENLELVKVFGVNVLLMVMFIFGFGIGFVGFVGVLVVLIYLVSLLMGVDFIIIIFVVVVIGGMGFIMGVVVFGIVFGFIEGVMKVFYVFVVNMVIFFFMVIVLLVWLFGFFGCEG